jgi:hypothetical protein
MHAGSGFGSGSNILWNKKSQKIKNKRPRETMLFLTLKRQDFVFKKLVEKLC